MRIVHRSSDKFESVKYAYGIVKYPRMAYVTCKVHMPRTFKAEKMGNANLPI